MILSSLLYISHSSIPQADAREVVDQIVATAHKCNPGLGLTGALLYTGTHFAQVLEGDGASIDLLMESVKRDPRHDQVMIVENSPIAERRFADWSMAYFGPSQFVSRHVTRLLSDPPASERRRAADWLTELLCEFSSD